VTPVVTRPIVVGQMLGLAEDGRFVASAGLRPGDVVVQVGPVPVEGAAVLAREAAGGFGALDATVLEAAGAAFERPGISVIEPALLAAELGATALHDPTEGGLAAGLHELADAARVRIRVDREAVLWFEPGLAVCRALGADPWSTLASGSLLATFPAETAEATLKALTAGGQPAAVIGLAAPGHDVFDGAGRPIPRREPDEVDRVLLEQHQ
jgi:hydrogenase maturation factor